MKQEKDLVRLFIGVFLVILGLLLIYLTLSGGTSDYLSSNLNMS
jgi:hypothetical protein